jgi:hypothetical protein
MTTAVSNVKDPGNTRRSPRSAARLPVLIAAETDSSKIAVPGLACEISQRGMALYGGVDLHPGDRMQVEFQTSGKPRVEGVVRNRSGFCFGLEFLESAPGSKAISSALRPASAAIKKIDWKAWIAAHRGDAAMGLAAFLLLIALSAAGWQSAHATQAKPSLSFSERVLVALGMAEAPPPPITTGNPNAQVWVDLHTALYYCQGSDLFGKTPGGKLTTQRDAQLDQFQPAARKNCE